MDKYNWLQVIGFAPLLSPAAMISRPLACRGSWRSCSRIAFP